MAGRPKGSTNKRNIVGENKHGFIEDVYGTGTSFNVFTNKLAPKFLRSCYRLPTAYKALGNYQPQRQPKALRR